MQPGVSFFHNLKESEGLKKAEKPSMLKLEHSPSHSWWWDSHNSPKHSKWLQSDLRELDEKVKEMLKLIEEDADSFAKRAEMYYQKRPELVSLVEEFYRAYRSLAERYDHLTGEIRQNIPRALQVQYGLSSCDSPRSTTPSGQRHTYSPLRKASQALHFMNDEAQSRSPPPPPRHSVRKCSLNEGLLFSPPEKQHTIIGAYGGSNGEYEVNVNGKENVVSCCIQSSDEGFSCSSDSEADHHRSIANPLGDADAMIVGNLRQEIDRLEKENKCLAESHQKALQCNSLLQDRIRVLEGEYACSRKEVIVDLEHEVGQLRQENQENHRQRNKKTEVVNHLREGIGSGIISMVGKEVQEIPVVDMIKYPDHAAGEEGMMGTDLGWKLGGGGDDEKKHMVAASVWQEPNVAVLIEDLQSQLTSMMEENEKQKLAIVERGEEKKEAIRQLCFTIDILHTRNQQLQEVVGVLRKRLNMLNGTAVGMTTTSMLFSFGSWSKFFTGEWGTSKVSSHPFAVAL